MPVLDPSSLEDIYTIKVVSSLNRYLQEDVDIEGDDEAILYCAKNESRAFQIYISNTEQAVASPPISLRLDGFDDVDIDVVMYREHYINITETTSWKSTDPRYTYRTGWHPDALIPFVNPQTGERIVRDSDPSTGPIVLENPSVDEVYYADDYEIPVDSSQGYWFEVKVGSGVSRGKHTANIIISVDGIDEYIIPIEVNVLNYSFPETHDFYTYLTNMNDSDGRPAFHYGVSNLDDEWDTIKANANATFTNDLLGALNG